MKRTKVLVSTVALLMLGACAPARPTPAEPTASPGPGAHDHHAHGGPPAGAHAGHGMAHGHGKSGGMMDGMCPMQVPGVTVATSDVEGGVSVVFTTATGDVADLRARVRRMAEMHDQMGGMHHGGRHMNQGPDGGAGENGMMRGCMMGKPGGMHAATATVEDVEGGARLTLKPKDGADLAALRAHVQKCRDRMQSGECPMMGGAGSTPAAAAPTP